MILVFKVCELEETSRAYQQLVVETGKPNKFILVGEDEKMGWYKVHQVCDGKITLINGLMLDESAFVVKKDDLRVKVDGIALVIQVFDIPKQYLTMDIIENIQRLND